MKKTKVFKKCHLQKSKVPEMNEKNWIFQNRIESFKNDVDAILNNTEYDIVIKNAITQNYKHTSDLNLQT